MKKWRQSKNLYWSDSFSFRSRSSSFLFFSFLKASAQEAFTKAGKGLAEYQLKDQKKEDRKLKVSWEFWKVDLDSSYNVQRD